MPLLFRRETVHERSQKNIRERKCDGTYVIECEISWQSDELRNTLSFKVELSQVCMRICDYRNEEL